MIVGFSLDICDRVSSHDKPMASPESLTLTTGQEDPKAKADERNGRWEEYKIHVELYKYYLDLVLKTNIAVFAILGAILTFYFTNKGKNIYLKKALYLRTWPRLPRRVFGVVPLRELPELSPAESCLS
jgi:hypothetical protein